MRQLREAYLPFTPITEAAVLEQLGQPTHAEIIETALAGMQSADRNVRVLMLRVLVGQSGAQAMQGILAGLNDPKRRVRSVAIKSSVNYLDFPEITNRLQAMVLDENEKRQIRGQALSVLAGHNLGMPGSLTDSMAETLETLTQVERYRWQILFGLVRLDLTDRVEELLKAFVEDGSKAEAIMATRALCGYRIINIGQFDGDEAAQRAIIQTCEIASGRVFYWITRDQYNQLVG
jgi:HEAT repeat protein